MAKNVVCVHVWLEELSCHLLAKRSSRGLQPQLF